MTTFEEYQTQRFEGAATVYGPHTLEGYIQVFQALATSMMTQQPVKTPDTFMKSTEPTITTKFDATKMTMEGRRMFFDLTPRRGTDHPTLSFHFGDVIHDIPDRHYHPTTIDVTVLSVSFVAGNPRHNPQPDGTFLTVERKRQDGSWEIIRNDHDYDTR